MVNMVTGVTEVTGDGDTEDKEKSSQNNTEVEEKKIPKLVNISFTIQRMMVI